MGNLIRGHPTAIVHNLDRQTILSGILTDLHLNTSRSR